MIDPQALITDAQRTAIPGAVGDAPDRPGQLLGHQVTGGVRATVPSGSPLAVAIDGSGLFVLDRDGERRYTRRGDFEIDASGRLSDRTGAEVLGFRVNSLGEPLSGLTVCQIPPADITAQRYTSYRLDERGVLYGDADRIDAKTGRREIRSTPIARLALAIFPAPERMTRDGQVLLAATSAAGHPAIVPPGDAGASPLRVRSLDVSMVDLEGDLARLWAARQRMESQVAIAAATDRDTRTALGLVK